MGDIEKNIVEMLLAGLGAALMALVGFVWRISHKVNDHQKIIEGMQELQRTEFQQMRRDLDYLVQKIDKESDKLYSIVRSKDGKN